MKNLRYIIAALALGAVVLSGCRKYDNPDNFAPVTMTPTLTIKQLKALCPTDGKLEINDGNMIIGGRVISSDRGGNLYRTFYIQDGTSGVEIKDGTRNALYDYYKIGQMVYVKLKALTLGDYRGMISVGFESTDPQYNNSWMDAPVIVGNAIYRGEIYQPLSATEITSGTQINDDLLGTWVKLVDAEYMGGNMDTWARKPNSSVSGDEGTYGEQRFKLSNGTVVVARTSPYAKFASNKVPFAVGAKVDVSAVFTKFKSGTNVTYQMLLNTDKDVVAK